MQYPHEREERKALYSALIDNVHSDLFLESVAVLVLGVGVISTAVIDSLFIHTSENFHPSSWLLVWTLSFALISLFLFLLPKCLPSQKKRKLYGIKRSFVIKNMFPTLLTGSVVSWGIGLHTLDQLPIVASLLCVFYALTIFSMSGFSMPSLKYYAIAISVIGMSFLILMLRHSEYTLVPQHIANIFLIVGIGIPSVSFGAWKSLIKPH